MAVSGIPGREQYQEKIISVFMLLPIKKHRCTVNASSTTQWWLGQNYKTRQLTVCIYINCKISEQVRSIPKILNARGRLCKRGLTTV